MQAEIRHAPTGGGCALELTTTLQRTNWCDDVPLRALSSRAHERLPPSLSLSLDITIPVSHGGFCHSSRFKINTVVDLGHADKLQQQTRRPKIGRQQMVHISLKQGIYTQHQWPRDIDLSG